MSKQKIICIAGPTASGKTAVSIQLAKRLEGEIVSADSVQVYRGLDIGSAKPSLQEQDGVPHHMLSCVDIEDKVFSVSRYYSEAAKCIHDIWGRGRRAIVVGGSGLYMQALVNPLNFAIPADGAVRSRLALEYDRDADALYARLTGVDASSAARIHPNDKKRVVRALEVFEVSGKPLSAYGGDFINAAGAAPPFSSIMFGLSMCRDILYRRIEQRVDDMLSRGLAEEARRIYDQGFNRRLPPMQSIGYRQLFRYFDGEWSLDDAVEDIKRETRRFAKRQITWFKRDTRIIWYDLSSEGFSMDTMIADMNARIRALEEAE